MVLIREGEDGERLSELGTKIEGFKVLPQMFIMHGVMEALSDHTVYAVPA